MTHSGSNLMKIMISHLATLVKIRVVLVTLISQKQAVFKQSIATAIKEEKVHLERN